MKNKLILACSALALAATPAFANPNLLDNTWVSGIQIDEQLITDVPGATYQFTFDYTGFADPGPLLPTIYTYWDWDTATPHLTYFHIADVGANSVTVDMVGTGSDDLYFFTENNGGLGTAGYITPSDFSLVELSGPGVPDATSASGLFGVALLGLAAVRRRLTAKGRA